MRGGPTKKERIDTTLFENLVDGEIFTNDDVISIMKKGGYRNIPLPRVVTLYLYQLSYVENLGCTERSLYGRSVRRHYFRYHKPEDSLWTKKFPNSAKRAKKKS